MKTSFGVRCSPKWSPVILALAALVAAPVAQAAHIFQTVATTGTQFDQFGVGSSLIPTEISLNNAGTVAFRASKGSASSIYTFSGGTLVTITTETTLAGNPVIQRYVQSPVINDGGLLAWLRYASDQGLSVRIGSNTPGAAGNLANLTGASNVSLGSSGRVMFYGSTGIGAGGIFTWGIGDTQRLQYCYSTGPSGNLAGYLDLIYAPHTASRSGTAIFRACFEMTSSSDTSKEGLFTGASAGYEAVVTNQNSLFTRFSNYAVINDSNQVAFIATLNEPDPTTGAQTGIFMRQNNQFPLVVPGTASGYNNFTALSLANNGTLLFVAQEGTQSVGIYLRSTEGVISRVVGTGDALAGSTALGVTTSATGLNESGQVAFMAKLADGRYGVFLATPATPGTVPVAVDDSLEIRGTTKLNVLANDSPATGKTLKITAVGAGAKGKAAISGTMINYTPGKTFDGTDSFSYTVSSNGYTATAQVTVTNPFVPLQGSFSQLVTADGAAVGTAAVTLTSGGAVSGKVVISGVTYALRGTAAFDGTFTQAFKRKPTGTPDLVVSLDFEKTEGLARVSGTASGDAVPYLIESSAATLVTLPAGIEAGTYTVLLPPDAESSHPRGTGYATAKLATNGKLTFSGKLGDGTAFTASTALNAEKGARLFVPLYVKPKGALSGTVTFATSPSRFAGGLAWVKPVPVKPVGLFATGFSATTQASGSRFLSPAKTARILTYSSLEASVPATLQMRDGGLAAPLEASLSVTLADKVTVTTTDTYKVKVTLNRSTGALTGSFVPAAGAKAISFSGILHQGENKGAGFFLGTTQTGTVSFTPQ